MGVDWELCRGVTRGGVSRPPAGSRGSSGSWVAVAVLQGRLPAVCGVHTAQPLGAVGSPLGMGLRI